MGNDVISFSCGFRNAAITLWGKFQGLDKICKQIYVEKNCGDETQISYEF